MGKTLAEKIWDDHVVRTAAGEPDLLFIDLHLIHEVTSPQAFDGLRLSGRPVRRPDLTLATEDHNIPTTDLDKPIADPVSRTQVETLRRNAEEFGVRLHPMGDIDQGIVHVVGPQLGLTQPGMTIVCGDSHTSTHGAFDHDAFEPGGILPARLFPRIRGDERHRVSGLDERADLPMHDARIVAPVGHGHDDDVHRVADLRGVPRSARAAGRGCRTRGAPQP